MESSPNATTGPLSESHLAELQEGRQAARGLRRAVAVARVSACSTGSLGLLTLLGALLGDMTSLVLGAVLVAMGVREWRLASRFHAMDRRAPGLLAGNQLALGMVILLYAAWQFWITWSSNGLSAGSQPIGDPRVDQMLVDIGSPIRAATLAFYGIVGVCGLLGTGLMALYYTRRGPVLDRFLHGTPAWVVQTMRAAA